MDDSYFPRRIIVVSVATVFLTTVAATGIASAQSISGVEIVGTDDYDDDSYKSNFNLSVRADTRTGGNWDPISGDPYFEVRIDGQTVHTTDIVQRRTGTFTLQVPRSKINSSVSTADEQTIEVVLFEKFAWGANELASDSTRALVEPVPDSRLALESLYGYKGAYNHFGDKRLNPEYHEGKQLESFFYTVEQVIPLKERDVAKGALTDAGDATAGTNTAIYGDLFSLVTATAWTADSLSHSKRASLLGEATVQDDGDFEKFTDDIDALEANTDALKQASSPTERQQLLERRLTLLEEAYRSTSEYQANAGASVGALEDDSFVGIIEFLYQGDAGTYETISGEFDQLKTQLEADYLLTQVALNRNDNRMEDLSAEAGYTQPTYPDPYVEVDAPDSVTAGEPVTVTLTVENRGGAAKLQTAAVSFPGIEDPSRVSITETGIENPNYADVYGPGRELGHKYGAEGMIEASYVLAELGAETDGNSEFTTQVTVVPRESGELRVLAKSVARDGGWRSYPPRDSSDRSLDQQDEYVITETIDVVEPNSEPNANDVQLSTNEDSDVSGEFDASDGDGDSLSYSIVSNPNHGTVQTNGASFTYSPKSDYSGQDSFTYRVTDGNGGTSEATVSITISNVITPPSADAGGDYMVDEGGSVTLDSSGSNDPDGSIQNIEWTVTDGPGSVSAGNYQAPDDVDSETRATVEVRVTDNDGETSTDTATVVVRDTDTPVPTADAGGSYTVDEGNAVSLDASDSTDPDGSIVTDEWSLRSGPGSVSGDTYRAPADVGSDTQATVELVVIDEDGATATDTATISIRDTDTAVPTPPTADAGGSYSVDEGGSVSLDASGSTDPDGSIASVEWRVSDGPGTVTDGSYQAPSDIDGDTEATLEVTVTGSDGATATDTATVSVRDTDTPDIPDTPLTSDTPDISDTSDSSDTPDTPDASDTSDTPDSLETSESSSQAGSISVTAQASQTIDGENVLVSFQVNNTGGESQAVIVDVGTVIEDLSGDWIVADRTDSGGAWRASEQVWLLQSVDPGSAATPSVRLAPPADASGEYTGTATVQTNSTNVTDTVSFEIRDASLVDAVDQNNDGRIGDGEILDAIEWWRTDQPVAGTDLRISNQQILSLAYLWQDGGSYR